MEQFAVIRAILNDRDRLFAYIWSILGNVHQAEDVLQEVTIVAIEKCNEIENESAVRAWLRTVARLKSMEAIRASRRQPAAMDAAVLDQIGRAWQRLDGQKTSDLVDALQACVNELSPKARKIVKLRYVDAMKSGEIAELLERKVATVYQALTRAHRALAECVRRRTGLANA
ncbi:MAG: sigma-70 family RNA polymerase sigma factor [Planctomycetota bacterium]